MREVPLSVRIFREAVAARWEIDLAAYTGLDSGLGEGLIELNRTEDIAVVRKGHSRHFKLAAAVCERLDGNSAVEEAIIRMDVKMYKIGVVHIPQREGDLPPLPVRLRRPSLSHKWRRRLMKKTVFLGNFLDWNAITG